MVIQGTFFYFSLAVLALPLILQLKGKLSYKFIRGYFWLIFAITAAYLSALSYLQFRAFQEGPLGLTLGTQSGIFWFANYVRLHFWNQYLVAFIFAMLILWLAEYLNKKRGEIFMEKEELYVAALGIFLVGYPGFLFYIAFILIVPAIAAAVFLKRGDRLPLYYFWLPTAIVILMAVQTWAMTQGWWNTFRF